MNGYPKYPIWMNPIIIPKFLIRCSLDHDYSPSSHQDGTFVTLNKAVIRLQYPKAKSPRKIGESVVYL